MKKAVVLELLFSFFISIHAQPPKHTHQKQYKTNDLTSINVLDSLSQIEKVYLHTDRKYYFAGDDVWLKAYLIEAGEGILSDHSKNLHVELISPSFKIISNRIIRLTNGLGDGDFHLSGDFVSGRYQLRAYTNYMRNFSDQLFFTKEIFIVNSSDGKDENLDKVKYLKNQIHINFFPEGGSLVDNVSSLISFKAANNLEKGCEVSGRIFSSKGDLVTTFISTHLGMGSFLLRPKPGLSYYAIFRGIDSIDFRTDLPESFSEGVALSASINPDNKLVIKTKSNPLTFKTTSDHDLILMLSNGNELIKTITCKIKSPDTYFVIPTNDLPDGILRLTLLTLNGYPLAERLVYVENEAPARIKIQTDKIIYNKRDPVSISISISGDSATDVSGNVSLAVADKNMTEYTSQYPRNIASWFLLESDVHGIIENPSYYFDPENTNRLKDMDLLLRTQGWRDFAWKYNKDYFTPEKGFTISGRLRRLNIDRAVKDSRVTVGIFGKDSIILAAVPVDSSGRFRLSGIDIVGDARLIVTGIGRKGKPKGGLNLDSMSYVPASISNQDSISFVLASISDSLPGGSVFIENRLGELRTYYQIIESIKKKYKLSDTIKLGEVKVISKKPEDPQTIKVRNSRQMYGKPEGDVIITPQMQSYDNPVEILRGHVAGVIVTGSFPDYQIHIRGAGSINAQGPPLVLIDGNQADFQDLITMPISFIDRIDVLKSIAAITIFGMKAANGVINLITRAGGPAYVQPEFSRNLKLSGYYAPRVFYSPQHLNDSASAYQPDLRSTLFWKPDINLENNKEALLNYYNGDNPSIFTIIVEGITSTGTPLVGKSEYEVK